MELQGRNLLLRMHGDDVALLQTELIQLSFVIDREEISAKQFGTTTQVAVLRFQREHSLEASGVVDENTARRVNAAIEGRSVDAVVNAFTLHGTVRNPDGSPVPRITVKAFDRNLRAETLLGEAPTDADGKYEIHYRQQQLRPENKSAADLIVRAYNQTGNELAHSDLLCHAAAEATVDLIVGNVPLRDPSEYDTLVARVRSYLGETALADLEKEDVQFLACSAGVSRRQIATLIVANRLTRETSLPDWLFYALGREGMLLQLPALLDHSLKNLRESITRAIESNIVAPLPNAAELDRWTDRLKSVLLKTTFEASADPGRLSVGELVGTSLVSRELQEMFLSRYLTREGSVAEFWRGLEEDQNFDPQAREDLRFTLHLGMLTQYHAPLMLQLKSLRQRGELKSLRDLAGFDRKHWRQLLEANRGTDEIILPPDTPGQNPEERLNNYITALREPIEALFPSDSLRHAITRAPSSGPAIQTFLANAPTLDLYWANVDEFVAEHVEAAFVGIADDERTNVVEETKTLQRLLRLAPSADQVTILRQGGFTSAYAIARTPRRHFGQRFVETAEELKDSLDGAYMVLSPSAGDMPAGDTLMMLLSGKTPEMTADLIFNQASSKAAASLEYLVNLHLLLEPSPFAVGGSKETQDQAKKEFFKKNPNLETLFGSLSYCECEHCRSVYSPAAYFVDLLHWLDNLEKDPNKGTLKYEDATIAMLPGGKGKAPINVLLARRSDVQGIALTCENTNTPLPYIDLVNEILESFILTHLKAVPNIDPNKPVAYEWSDAPATGKTLDARDTGGTVAAELRAVPQYIIPEVYEHLATKAVFPMTLPFHRSLEVVRGYLDHLGTSRAEIMEAFQTGTPLLPSEQDLSTERLELSSALMSIITASGNAGTIGNMDVWQYYGFGKFEAKIAKVSEFLTRTGLSMEELVALLKTRFVNPHVYDKPQPPAKKTITIEVDAKDPCDVSKMTLQNLTWMENEVSEFHWLKRIHRFLRLWRALQWPTTDLDAALHAFGGTLDNDVLHEDPNILSRFEAVDRLHFELNVSIPNLLAFWSDLDTWGEDSAYARVFLTQSLTPKNPESGEASPNELFKLKQSDLADTSKDLPDHLTPIFATLQLTAADYDAIALHEFTGPNAVPKLNIKNLSLLFRYGTLARSLKLRVKDIVTLLRLVPEDHDPFHASDPRAAVRFVRLAQTIQDSNFSVPLLNYLLRHEEEPTRHPAPTRVLTFTSLKAIAEGLAQVKQETQLADDPLGESLRKQLSELQPLLTPPKTGEEANYIKPDEIAQTVDVIDWRRDNFQQDAGKTFLQKLHDTLLKDLNSSFLGPDLSKDKSALFDNLQLNETKDERFAKNVVYLRDKLLPWLRVRMQRSLVFQTLAAALGLEESIAKTLVERVLDSTAPLPTAGKAQPALTDFLNESALNDLLKLVKDQGGPHLFDILNQKTPPVLTFVRLFKAAQVAKAFEMTEAELTYLSDNGSSFENFNLNKLPLELTQSETLTKELFLGWIALERFFDFRNSLPRSEKALVDVLKDKSVPTIVEATGWDKQWVNSLLKLPPQGIDMLNSPPEGPGNVLANLTAADLVRLRNAIALIKRTGAPAKTLLLWSQKEPDYAQAEEVIETVKSRYEQSDWLEVARGLNDPLREKQRTALVDFLVARMSWPHPQLKIWSSLKESVTELQRKLNVALAPLQPVLPAVLPLKVDGIFGPNTETAIETFQDTNKIDVDGIVGPATWAALDRAVGDVFDKNSLLGHFLIDTEMSSCMLTSRIKQAISSVQMFIQRCLLNLESEVSPDDIDADQWKWMKNYRVWEANRKVFLYPENWIEPELRDDKTPFFKELETELLQNELTDETVETALVNYLYKLDGVARLDIRGFCKEEKEQDGEEKEIYHVFGRTWNPPFVYYYRKGTFPKNGPLADEWTPWEPVDLDIQGDHLIPLVANRRLYLFWLVLDEKPDPESPQTGGVEPHTRWEARLAWSEFKWGKWAPRRVTFDVIHADKGAPNKNTPKDEYRLRLVTFGGPEKIDLLLLRHLWKGSEENEISGIHEFTRKGIFSFNVCDQKIETWDVDSGESVTITGPEVSFVEGQAYRTPLSSLILQDLPEKEILKKIDLKLGVPFYVLTDTDLSREGPFSFCYGDPTCTYLARPLPENVTVPQDTETWTESTVTIKKPAQIDTKKGWTKPSSDLVDDLAGNTMSGS
jgi:peptidoglycan hydrolase-like protein with peptidoglycan-binding domain